MALVTLHRPRLNWLQGLRATLATLFQRERPPHWTEYLRADVRGGPRP